MSVRACVEWFGGVPEKNGPILLERLRERGVTDFASRYFIAVLFGLICQNLLGEFWRTGHLTGLVFLVSESLVVVFTLLRRRAFLVDRSAGATLVTTLSVAGPSLLRARDVTPILPDVVTTVILVCGALLAVAAKLTLGRSFGFIPANRGVIVKGPYKFVRHPIYAGYLITHAAFVLAHPDLLNILVIVVADAALVVRALMEERVLSGDADYRSYCTRVSWHLVPLVF
jgi:protein-S-isoprenylcysteine O-methyltransferase Ste14